MLQTSLPRRAGIQISWQNRLPRTFAVDAITGIEDDASSLKVYPNPFETKLFIEAPDSVCGVEIISVIGPRRVYAVSPEGAIDVTDLSSGIYFVKINTIKGSSVLKLIKK